MPKISIIIPCYNVEKYLSRCLDSVLGQSFDDFEAICVNDGSTDNTPEILEEYAKRDRRIRVITQENQGLSMARNNGKAVALGQYIYFLDSDDAIHPQCLEIAYDIAEKYAVDMVSFGIAANANESQRRQKFTSEDIQVFVTDNPFFQAISKVKRNKIFCQVWTKLFRKSILENIQFIPHIYFEDYPYVFGVLAQKPKTAIIETKLYFYMDNTTSITHQTNTPKHLQDYHEGINFLYNIYKNLEPEFTAFKTRVVPSLLRQQWQRCQQTPAEKRKILYPYFAAELKDLAHKGALTIKGHKLKHYLTYQYLMLRY